MIQSNNGYRGFKPNRSIKINNLNIDFNTCHWEQLRTLESGKSWWIDIINFLELFSNESEKIHLQTSGSTGKPKVIETEKYKLYNSAIKTVDYFNLSNTSIGLLCLSANYIAGKMMLVRAIVSGMTLICIEPKEFPLENTTKAIDFAAMVPMQVKACLHKAGSLNIIKKLIIGGGAVDGKTIEGLKKTSAQAFETFGMTETFSHIAVKQLSPNTDLHFTALNDVKLSKSEEGTLIISSPDIGINQLETNDMVALKSHYKFEWLGRKDFVINSGGIKISPEQIEKKIASLIPSKFCILGLPDDKLGEKLTLVIEGKAFDTKAISKSIKAILPTYQQPKQISFVNQFPLTNSGKIRRKEMIIEIKKANLK